MRSLFRSRIRPIILTMIAPIAGFTSLYLLEVFLNVEFSGARGIKELFKDPPSDFRQSHYWFRSGEVIKEGIEKRTPTGDWSLVKAFAYIRKESCIQPETLVVISDAPDVHL